MWSCQAERGNKGHVKKRQKSWGPEAFRQIEDGACQKKFEKVSMCNRSVCIVVKCFRKTPRKQKGCGCNECHCVTMSPAIFML